MLKKKTAIIVLVVTAIVSAALAVATVYLLL